jgi:hypothetical protein
VRTPYDLFTMKHKRSHTLSEQGTTIDPQHCLTTAVFLSALGTVCFSPCNALNGEDVRKLGLHDFLDEKCFQLVINALQTIE